MRKGLIALVFIFISIFCQKALGQVLIGQYPEGYNGEGLSDTATKFGRITFFCKDSAENYYIVDQDNYRIRKSDHIIHTVQTIAGNGTLGTSGDGGPAPIARISGRVGGICTDRSGNVYILDSNRIRKINATTGVITTVAGGGSSIADGIPGVTAKLVNPRGLCIDSNSNLYYCDVTAVRKVDAVTGIISTIAGNMSSGGFGGDGGPATSALIGSANNMAIDKKRGMIYFYDAGNFRLRSIDASGNIQTIAGNGISMYSGDGGLAINASLSYFIYNTANYVAVDTAGDIYINCWNHPPKFNGSWYDGDMIGAVRKISRSTGMITRVGGRYSVPVNYGYFHFIVDYNYYSFIVNADKTIESSVGWFIYRKEQDRLYINHLSLSDTLLSDSCRTPAHTGFGIKGTIFGTPLASDSVSLKVTFGDDSIVNIKVPYYLTTDATTGALVYGFGAEGNWIPHTYIVPGRFIRYVEINHANSGSDMGIFDTIYVRNTCSNKFYDIEEPVVTDSVLSAPCVLPNVIRTDVKGNVTITGNLESTDSVIIVLQSADSPNIVVHVPLTFHESWTFDTWNYNDSTGEDYLTIDTFTWCTYDYGWYHSTSPHNVYDYGFDYSGYYEVVIGTARINDQLAEPLFEVGRYNVDDCSQSVLYASTGFGWPPTASTCPYSVPYNTTIHADIRFTGSAASLITAPFIFHFGDGTDTTVYLTPEDENYVGYYHREISLPHVYSIEGTYVTTITPPPGIDSMITEYGALTLSNSCSPVDGIFYLDANHNCVADTGEVRLQYWPFIIVNNTTGDTTNAWTGGDGHYHISLADANSYTLIPMHREYGATSTDSFVVACPVAGSYSLTASAGVAFTQDFGINIYHPVDPAPDSVDMRVAGWGWGFIPGDTGIISIWSSNEWGYTGYSLASDITLTLDSQLTYLGMWNGPAPTTIAGNILTWHFATAGSLFDFTGSVKVSCATTATMDDTIHNILYVAPTTLTDPDIANNTYSWSEPVKTSWDPNEKDVSPKGYGTEGYIPNGTPLNYVVHFQNTGTAQARHIKIVDTISAHLDMSTLQVINSTAPVLLFQTAENTIQFRFNDINLPDSMDDPEGSKGFVAFSILPKDNLSAGTQINNTANIYFDYNPAVVTNTTTNTIEDSVRVITGGSNVCLGGTITLSNGLAGGMWSVTNGNATVLNGIVTGVHAGVDTIVYTMYGDKPVYKIITVLSSSDAGIITGNNTVCTGVSTTLTNAITGGTWSSSNELATVTDGVVTGVTAGSAIITYTVSGSCGTGTDTMMITVNPLPDAGTITGSNTVCALSVTTLSNVVAGGVWMSSTASATVAGGVVTGASAGSSIITYSVTNNCGTAVDTMMMTVNPLPDAGTITGSNTVCALAVTTLSNVVAGGIWTGGTTSATVAGGVVTGASAGSSIISYSVTNTCGTAVDTMEITVGALPDAGEITGSNTLCALASTSLSNIVTGGTWSSSTSAATITGGMLTGVSAGTSLISYTVTNSCGTAVDTMEVTVNGLPDAGSITGTSTLCATDATTLTASAAGGVWTTVNGTVSINASGNITATTTGTDTVLYVVTTACGSDTAMQVVSVSAMPVAGTIIGLDTVCEGSELFLSGTGSGGSWTSSDAGIISVTTGGMITAVAAGTATISYAVTNSCGTATASHSIYVVPASVCNTLGIGRQTALPISIYPNPSTGTFIVQIPSPVNNATITVTDVSGKVIQVIRPQAGQLQTQVSLSGMASGTYMLKVEADGRVYRDKITLW